MAIIESFTQIVLSELSQRGFDTSKISSPEDCAMAYMHTLYNLTIPRQKRQVVKSQSFVCPPEHQKGLDAFELRIKKGDSLNGHLSKGTSRLKNLDKLLFDWGIHHFHLGEGYEANGRFIVRTGPVAFGVVKDHYVYLLTTLDHNNWGELDLLEIMDNSFPFLLDSSTIMGAVGLEYHVNANDVVALRNSNINTVIQLKSGRIVSSIGGGISSAGTSIKARRAADNLLDFIDYLEANYTVDCKFMYSFTEKAYYLSDGNGKLIWEVGGFKSIVHI